MRTQCDICAEARAYVVSVLDEAGEALVIIGSCGPHLAAAFDRCCVLVETADVEGLDVNVGRSVFVADPGPGPFDMFELDPITVL